MAMADQEPPETTVHGKMGSDWGSLLLKVSVPGQEGREIVLFVFS